MLTHPTFTDYTSAIELDPDYAEAYYNRAYDRSEIRDYQGAIADYTKVIELAPDAAPAYFNRGLAKQPNPQEQLQLVSYLMNIWQQPPLLNEISNQIFTDKTTTIQTLSRKHLFGCMKDKIKMAPDFDVPLADFAEYM